MYECNQINEKRRKEEEKRREESREKRREKREERREEWIPSIPHTSEMNCFRSTSSSAVGSLTFRRNMSFSRGGRREERGEGGKEREERGEMLKRE